VCTTFRVEYIWSCVLKLVIVTPNKTVKFRWQIRKSAKFGKCRVYHIQGRIHLELCSQIVNYYVQ